MGVDRQGSSPPGEQRPKPQPQPEPQPQPKPQPTPEPSRFSGPQTVPMRFILPFLALCGVLAKEKPETEPRQSVA